MHAQHVHLLKLCVGIESVSQLEEYRAKQRAQARSLGRPDETRHITRMRPRREAELLRGGSLYWVIKGVILARQNILRLETEDGEDGIRRCAIVMAPEIIRTQAAPRRPFQGWRYLPAQEAPPDLGDRQKADENLPDALRLALGEIGVR